MRGRKDQVAFVGLRHGAYGILAGYEDQNDHYALLWFTDRFAAAIEDRRPGEVDHSRFSMVRQRIYRNEQRFPTGFPQQMWRHSPHLPSTGNKACWFHPQTLDNCGTRGMEISVVAISQHGRLLRETGP